MSVEFDTPANRVIAQQQPKNQFRIDTSLPDLSFLRQLSVQGRLWFEQAEGSLTNANLLTRTTAIGSTDFYFRAIINVTGTGSFVVTITTDDMTRFKGSFPFGSHQIDIFDSLVGDSIKTINIGVVETGTAIVNISLFGWSENTSRIRDVVS